MKADLDLVKLCLQRNELDARQVASIVEDITQEVQAAQEDKPPREKLEHIILVSDPDGRIEGDVTGWVLKIPEDESAFSVLQKINAAAYEFNVTPKGRRMPVKTVGEALEVIPRRIFKEQGGTRVVTKEPIILVKTDNRIPRDEGI